MTQLLASRIREPRSQKTAAKLTGGRNCDDQNTNEPIPKPVNETDLSTQASERKEDRKQKQPNRLLEFLSNVIR